MTPEIIAGSIVLVLGGLMAVRPDIMMRWQIWTQRVILGAEYIPSKRTYMFMRSTGAIVFIFGLLIVTGILK